MADIKRHETQWAEMSPDIYAGQNCDQVKARFRVWAEGDRGGDEYEDRLGLSPNTFPPGTLITIAEPVCPLCDEPRDPVFPIPRRGPLYKGPCRCGFDWDAWVQENYS
jgi:hypothetical protein